MASKSTPSTPSTPVPPTTASPRNPCTPDTWIEAALALLVDGGVDRVRVDVIAKQLGVTRGSFYWHFKDRDDLLQHLLQHWRSATTEQVTARFERGHTDPRALIHDVLSLPFRGRSARRAASIELAIRDWARRDPMARQAVDEADARRIAYVAQCFSALGFSIAEARHRAAALYAYEVGESLLIRQDSPAQKAERSALFEALMVRPLPTTTGASPDAASIGTG